MDVKHLEKVDDDGLEQWQPVMKAAFPLPAADVGDGARRPARRRAALARASYTLDEFSASSCGRATSCARSRSTSGVCATPSAGAWSS